MISKILMVYQSLLNCKKVSETIMLMPDQLPLLFSLLAFSGWLQLFLTWLGLLTSRFPVWLSIP